MMYFTPIHGGVTVFVAIAVTSLQCVIGSDDVNPLEPVVTQLSQVVNQLQTKLDALQRTVEKSEPSVLFSVQHTAKYFNVSKHDTLLFDRILINIGSGYSARHGEFTAPVSGLYQVSYRGWCNKGQHYYLGLIKNDEIISELPVGDRDFESASSQSLVVHFQQGDFLSVVGYADASVNMMGGDRTTFMGYLLKAD